jgi:hypothetical protein
MPFITFTALLEITDYRIEHFAARQEVKSAKGIGILAFDEARCIL